MASSGLEIKVQWDSDISIYTLSGRLDESSFNTFSEKLDPKNLETHVILNLAKLKYASSSGIRSIFELKNGLQEKNKILVLTEASEKIIHIFSLLGLWKPFYHFQTQSEAISFLESSE